MRQEKNEHLNDSTNDQINNSLEPDYKSKVQRSKKRSKFSSVVPIALSLAMASTTLMACSNQSNNNDSSVSVTEASSVGDADLHTMLNLPGEVIGTIGGQDVFDFEYRYILETTKLNVLNQFGAYLGIGSPEEDEFWQMDLGGMTALEYAEGLVFDNLKQLKILYMRAIDKGVTLEASELEAIAEEVNTHVATFDSTDAAEQYFQDSFGVSILEYVALLQKVTLAYKYCDLAIDEIQVSEEQMKALYDENIEDLEEVTVIHVLFMYEGTDEQSPRTHEESKALAEDILARINNGEDIKQLSIDYSEDTGEGEYTFTRGENFVPEFLDWSFSAELGDTGIIETAFGYHVMKLMDKNIVSFEDLRDQIEISLKNELFFEDVFVQFQDESYDIVLNEEVFNRIK